MWTGIHWIDHNQADKDSALASVPSRLPPVLTRMPLLRSPYDCLYRGGRGPAAGSPTRQSHLHLRDPSRSAVAAGQCLSDPPLPRPHLQNCRCSASSNHGRLAGESASWLSNHLQQLHFSQPCRHKPLPFSGRPSLGFAPRCRSPSLRPQWPHLSRPLTLCQNRRGRVEAALIAR